MWILLFVLGNNRFSNQILWRPIVGNIKELTVNDKR